MKALFEKLGGYLSDKLANKRLAAPSGSQIIVDSSQQEIAAAGLGGKFDPDLGLRAAVILTDAFGRIYECNENVEAVIGFRREDLIGRLTTSFTLDSTHWAARRPEIIALLGRGDDWRGEVEMWHKDGSTILVRLHMSAIKSADGEQLGTISAFVGIEAEGISFKTLRRNVEIMSQIREGISLNAADGTLLDCNAEAARQIGYTREEMIGTAVATFVADPEGYLERRDEVLVLLVENKTWRDRIAFRHKDGSERILDIRLSPLLNSEGEYHASVAFSTDVTEQHLAEIDRLRSDDMFRNAQRIAHIGSWEWDIVGESLEWSDEVYRIFGLRPQAFGATYEAFLEAVHPSDRSDVEEGVRRALEDDISYHLVHRVVRPDGEVRHVEEQAEVARDEEGTPIRMSGTVQDITDRHVIELALKQSQCQLDEAQAIANMGHFNIPIDAERAEWSPSLKRMFKLEEDEPAPTYEEFLEMVHPDDIAGVKKNYDQSVVGEAPDSSSFRAIIGGHIRHIQVRQEIKRNANGEIIAVFGTFQDITAARKAEIAAQDNKALLERAQSIAKIGHWEFWTDLTRLPDWSDECKRIFGVSADDDPPDFDAYLAAIHEDDRDRVSEIIKNLVVGEIVPAFTYRLLVGDDLKYVSCRNFLNRDESGVVQSVFGTIQDVTEQRLVEIELEKNETLLEDAQKLAHMGHWEFNVALDEGYWSDSIYAMLGFEKGEVEPSSEAFRPLLHPDDLGWFAEYEKQLSTKGVRPVLNFRVIIKGETRYIQMRSHEDRDETGNLRRIYGTTQDVTEIKGAEENMRQMNANLEMRVKMRTAELTAEVSERTKAEEQLRAQQEFSEQLINVADVGIVVLDNDGKIQRMNRYLEDVTGYGADEVLGEDWFETMLPDFERHRIRGVFAESLEGGDRASTTNAIRAKSGKLRYMEWSDAPLTGPDGGVIGLLAIGQDVTQRLRDQAQIFELSRRNEQILEAAGEGIYGVDLAGNCTFINNAGCQMLDLRSDDIIGANAHEAIHHSHPDGSHYEAQDCPIYAAFSEGRTQTVSDEVFWRGNGSKFPVEYTSTPIIEDGRITGAVVVFRDTSDAQLMQQQVIQTSKLATLGEMATGVAHEINQPLNIIRMAASNVRRKLEKGGIDANYIIEKLERIDSQTGRAAEIIDHMRVFGRKSDTIPVPIDPVKTTNAALAMVSQQLKLANIELDIDVDPNCGKVMGHMVQLEQVLLNLLGNARHQLQSGADSQNGAGRIGLCVRQVPADDPSKVEIVISDNGGGIDEDVLPRIFEPFFTTKEIGEGTGLGLSISYGIIGDMGGAIFAGNVGEGAERGAAFTVSLPLAKVKTH